LAGEYELVLMLDPEAPDERREKIATDVRKLIEGSGTLKHGEGWGMRKMAYEIRHRTEADYHFFRFEAANPLLEQLDHTLKITDGTLRFRIFKVDPGTPLTAPPAASGPGGRAAEPRGRPEPSRERTEAPPPDAPPPEAPPPEAPPPEAPAATPEPAPAEGGEPASG
jgi:small subunit ribosomal protein S6